MARELAWRRATLVAASCIGFGLAACSGSDDGDNPFANPNGTTRPNGDDDDTTSSSSSGHPSGSSGRPSGSSASSSGGSGSSSSSGGSSSSSSGSNGSSSSGAPPCADPEDAPDLEAAVDYAAIQADGATDHALPGVLDGELDVDWYGYDITGSPVTVVSVTEAVPAELCVFTQCKAGQLHLECRSGSVSDVDDDGNPGCCATGSEAAPAALSTYMYCISNPDDNFTTLRVTSLADQCAEYTVHAKF